MVGIVAYGAYVPRLRLNRQAVYDANKWFAAGLRGLAKGERSMANWDEDSITMAVEADSAPRKAITASASLPWESGSAST